MTLAASTPASADTFIHYAMFYTGAEDYQSAVADFLGAGLADGEPALVAVPGPNLELLRTYVGELDGQVTYLDMSELGRNPARIIPAVRRFTDEHAGGRTRFVGEPIWPGRSAAEIGEAVRHEGLINAAFADAAVTVLCPYDTSGLSEHVIADAETTHPSFLRNGVHSASLRYAGTGLGIAHGEHPLPSAPADAATLAFDNYENLSEVRHFLREHVRRAGLHGERLADLVVSANEIATNALVHGGHGGVRVWRQDREVVCELSDGGTITDQLAGRRLPSATATHGRGLWIANQLCDLVELRSGPTGTIARLHVRVP